MMTIKNRHIAVCIALMLAITCGAANKQIDKLIQQLTLEQKARLLVGWHGSNEDGSHIVPGAAGWTYAIPELGIPSINLADGPVGVRINPTNVMVQTLYDENGLPIATADATADGAECLSYCTAFPSTTALAATWSVDDARRQGEIMGDEARCYGVDVILSPGINIMRNPLCGRNFEYYSEDPLLTGVLAAEVINGIQSQGIGTSLKHFVANNQQTGKKYNDPRMTQRALREIYLRGFETCVKQSKPWTVMGSYNKIAGEFTQTNRELLLDLLRDEWGWSGLVMTDWTVRRPTADLLNAHTALMMPGEEEIVQEIIAAVNNGEVSEATLDACVADLLGLVMRSITVNGWTPATPDMNAHAAESRHIATESMVLLKNDAYKGVKPLPLSPGAKVSLFGASAYKSIGGGTGSSNVNKPHVIDIDDALRDAGYRLSDRLTELYTDYDRYMSNMMDQYPDCPDWQKISYHRAMLPEADIAVNPTLLAAEAQNSDVAVIVIGRGSGETSDRVIDNDFNLSAAEQRMVKAVGEAFHKQGKPVVVVLNICGTIEIASWRDIPDAILVAWLPGQECGYAVADVLSGAVNPSGRLPMTFPIDYYDIPSSMNYPFVGQTGGKNFDYTNYEEDIWVGYRYFTTANRPTAYGFGYGLSYTTFDYSNLCVKRRGDKYLVSVTVTNTGDCAGKDVVQVYVKAPENPAYPKPAAELKAFAKTRLLQPGEQQTLQLEISEYSLASFDQEHSQWLTDAGKYVVYIGLPTNGDVPAATFDIAKSKSWRVKNILAPVKPVKTIDINHLGDTGELTVMSYNLHAGADASIDSIAEVLNSVQPAFVALQEVDAYTRRGNAKQHNGNNIAAQLGEATNMFPLYGRTLDFAGGYYGIGLLSKYPCLDYQVIELPNPDNHEPRVLLEGLFDVEGKKVIVASTHLCVESEETRDLQAQFIADRYADSKYPVILGGDLNSLPDSRALGILQQQLANLSGSEYTFPATVPNCKLDYILGNRRVNPVTTSVIGTTGTPKSDHCPVTATITIR